MSCGRPPQGCCWGGGPWGGVSLFQFPASSQDDSAAGLEREPRREGDAAVLRVRLRQGVGRVAAALSSAHGHRALRAPPGV